MWAEISIYRDNLSAIVFYRFIVIAQNGFDLLITDIALVIYFVIAVELSRSTIVYAHSVKLASWRYGKNVQSS